MNALQLQKADLSNALTQERHLFSRIIQELTTENAALKEDKEQLKRWLSNEQERGVDKERLIASLEKLLLNYKQLLPIRRTKQCVKTGS